MGRFERRARWSLLTSGSLAVLVLNACTLLSGVNELDDGLPATAGDGEGGATPRATSEDGSTGTLLGSGDAADHKTTAFDAQGFPIFDATPILDAADGATNYFLDDFNRAAGDPLGNGWLERAPIAFQLENNAVKKTNPSVTMYRDNIVYRPPLEDALDVEARLEIRVNQSPAKGNPQLWARAQKIGPNVIDGYHVYLDDGFAHFHVARHVGAFSSEIGSFDAPSDLEPGKVYRLVLQVTGTNPVRVYGRIDERRSNGTWQMLAESGVTDDGSGRVQTRGAVGFSADVDGMFTYDNFERILP